MCVCVTLCVSGYLCMCACVCMYKYTAIYGAILCIMCGTCCHMCGAHGWASIPPYRLSPQWSRSTCFFATSSPPHGASTGMCFRPASGVLLGGGGCVWGGILHERRGRPWSVLVCWGLLPNSIGLNRVVSRRRCAHDAFCGQRHRRQHYHASCCFVGKGLSASLLGSAVAPTRRPRTI